MKKATLVVSISYQKNNIFDMNNPVNGRDNHMYIMKELKDLLFSNDINLCTQDINKIEESDYVFYNDIPAIFPVRRHGQKIFLIAMESIAVLSNNFNLNLYNYFDKIFTFNDDIIDEKKIIKINYSFNLKAFDYINFKDKTGFICMVCGNKYSNYKYELYSERLYLINYFEKKSKFQFSLYGTNWDQSYKLVFYKIIKSLHKYRFTFYFFKLIDLFINIFKLQKVFKIKYSNYKGMLSPKIPKLRYYKFNICYENTSNINGYITEKIFDCFLSGCVPVYLGAPNITKYIPSNTFIDRRNFNSNDDLLNYLLSINSKDYDKFQENIKYFLESDNSLNFSTKFVANKIFNHI